MLAPLRVDTRVLRQRPVTVAIVIQLLHSDQMNALELDVRYWREQLVVPVIVKDYEEFKNVLFDAFVTYEKTFGGVAIAPASQDASRSEYPNVRDPALQQAANFQHWRTTAFQQFLTQHLGDAHAVGTAVRNAQLGREGGMPGVLNKITESLIKAHHSTWVYSVFFELLDPSDHEKRLLIVEGILQKFGGHLFPGDQLAPAWVLAANTEAFVQHFVTFLNNLRNAWQR
jgi:hypothetical protein